MNTDENREFNRDFSTDGEVESAIDSLLREVAKKASDGEEKASLLNTDTMLRLSCVYRIMRHLTKGQKDVTVGYEVYEPFLSMGSVSVIGKNISVRKPEWFMRAVEMASNFEVYPKTDGTVQMNFGFHGLTTPME